MLNIEEVKQRLLQTANELEELARDIHYGYPNLSAENKQLVRLAFISEIKALTKSLESSYAMGHRTLFFASYERLGQIHELTAE